VTVEFVPIRPDHFRRIKLSEVDLRTVFSQEAGAWAGVCDPRWSDAAIENGETLALGGILADGRAWFIFSTVASVRQIYLIRERIRAAFVRFSRDNPSVQIRATIDEAYPKRVRWIKRLGFSRVGESNEWVLRPS
jgi:hypothetical protein